MKEKQAKELLTRYLLGDLDDATQAEVKACLDESESCRAEAREIEPTLDLLRSALAAPGHVPERLSAERRTRIMAAGAAEKRGETTLPKVLHWFTEGWPALARTAALLLVCFVIAGLIVPATVSVRRVAREAPPPCADSAAATAPYTGRVPPDLEVDDDHGTLSERAGAYGNAYGSPPPTSDRDEDRLKWAWRSGQSGSGPAAPKAAQDASKNTYTYWGDTDGDSHVAYSVDGSEVAWKQSEGRRGVHTHWNVADGADRTWKRAPGGEEKSLDRRIDPFYDQPAPSVAIGGGGGGGQGEDESGGARFRAYLHSRGDPTPGESAPVQLKPVELDSIETIKSPIIMRGIYGSRNPGTKTTTTGGDEASANEVSSVNVSGYNKLQVQAGAGSGLRDGKDIGVEADFEDDAKPGDSLTVAGIVVNRDGSAAIKDLNGVRFDDEYESGASRGDSKPRRTAKPKPAPPRQPSAPAETAPPPVLTPPTPRPKTPPPSVPGLAGNGTLFVDGNVSFKGGAAPEDLRTRTEVTLNRESQAAGAAEAVTTEDFGLPGRKTAETGEKYTGKRLEHRPGTGGRIASERDKRNEPVSTTTRAGKSKEMALPEAEKLENTGTARTRIDAKKEPKPNAPEKEMVPLKLKLPKPLFVGTPKKIKSDNLESYSYSRRVPDDIVAADPAAVVPAKPPAKPPAYKPGWDSSDMDGPAPVPDTPEPLTPALTEVADLAQKTPSRTVPSPADAPPKGPPRDEVTEELNAPALETSRQVVDAGGTVSALGRIPVLGSLFRSDTTKSEGKKSVATPHTGPVVSGGLTVVNGRDLYFSNGEYRRRETAKSKLDGKTDSWEAEREQGGFAYDGDKKGGKPRDANGDDVTLRRLEAEGEKAAAESRQVKEIVIQERLRRRAEEEHGLQSLAAAEHAMKAGDYQSAIRLYGEAEKLVGDRPETREARANLKGALPEAYERWGAVLAKRGEKEGAERNERESRKRREELKEESAREAQQAGEDVSDTTGVIVADADAPTVEEPEAIPEPRPDPESKPEPEPEPEPEDPTRFRAFGVNPFYSVKDQPFSTFSIDVDTAAYALARRYMSQGFLPPAEAVRTEEFVNFFDYGYKAPTHRTFRVFASSAPSRFGRGLHLVKVGIKGRRLGREEQRQAVLTFLIDTSGSMDKPDRIELVQQSLRLLVSKLDPDDRVAIVQYSSHARVLIEHTAVRDRKRILTAIDTMQCGGSTNLEEGMRRAYQLAAAAFVPGGENRVLLLSDGVANLGTGSAADILKQVDRYRKQGITCSVFGFGMGTYDDEMLETLANKGDGNYTFIDSREQARRVFVDDLAATLNTIAADVKIQVEFDPKRVKRYRQLGYENRQLAKEDFRNDSVDAGEVGSGQSVTALYEVELADTTSRAPVCTVRVRYRRVDTGAVEEIEDVLKASNMENDFRLADSRFRLAACAAEFAEILRASPYAAGSEYAHVAAVLRPVALELDLDNRVQELLRLVQGAGSMSRGE